MQIPDQLSRSWSLQEWWFPCPQPCFLVQQRQKRHCKKPISFQGRKGEKRLKGHWMRILYPKKSEWMNERRDRRRVWAHPLYMPLFIYPLFTSVWMRPQTQLRRLCKYTSPHTHFLSLKQIQLSLSYSRWLVGSYCWCCWRWCLWVENLGILLWQISLIIAFNFIKFL